MAEGDLIVADGQYEYGGLLMNPASSDDFNKVIVISAEGLFGLPDVEHTHTKRQGAHGAFYGQSSMNGRTATLQLGVLKTKATLWPALLEGIMSSFGDVEIEQALCYQKPGLAKRAFWCRPQRVEIVSDSAAAQGWALVTIEVFGADPRHYTLQLVSETQDFAGIASWTDSHTNAGNFTTGPVFTLTGPWTNPRITNNDQGRGIRIDGVLAAGHLLRVDPLNQTVWSSADGGATWVDRSSWIRTDNQWWLMHPGANSITISRTGTAGGSAKIDFRHGWRG